jgi:phage terminase small subunit
LFTAQKQKFCEAYLEKGNATEAAKIAGYSEKTAYSQGGRLLKDVECKAYIQERLNIAQSKNIASADEVLQFLTRVLRGEEKDQFGLDASLQDRTKAGVELLKRYDASKDDTQKVLDKLDAVIGEIDAIAKS